MADYDEIPDWYDQEDDKEEMPIPDDDFDVAGSSKRPSRTVSKTRKVIISSDEEELQMMPSSDSEEDEKPKRQSKEPKRFLNMADEFVLAPL